MFQSIYNSFISFFPNISLQEDSIYDFIALSMNIYWILIAILSSKDQKM